MGGKWVQKGGGMTYDFVILNSNPTQKRRTFVVVILVLWSEILDVARTKTEV